MIPLFTRDVEILTTVMGRTSYMVLESVDCRGRGEDGSGHGHSLHVYMDVGIQAKKCVLKDDYMWGGGGMQSRRFIEDGPGHPLEFGRHWLGLLFCRIIVT